MKIKYLVLVIIAALGFAGCDDNTRSLGMGMLPDTDLSSTSSKTYKLNTESVLSGPVFSKTSQGYIGKYSDKEFGYFESGFLTEFYCPENFELPTVYDEATNPEGDMVEDNLLRIELSFLYDRVGGWFGDSLNACRMSVYELDQKLDKYTYTDIDPTDYYDPTQAPLARKAYSAVDLSISEEDRHKLAKYNVTMSLNDDFKERFYQTYKSNPEYFKDPKKFSENVIKGIYAKSDNGDGTVLYIDYVQMNIYFNVFVKDTLGNVYKMHDQVTDSTAIGSVMIAATREVHQANQFINSNKVAEKAAEDQWTYLKSPAGIYTRAKLPIQQIYDDLSQDTINTVKLKFNGYRQTNTDQFSMNAPAFALLVREKDLEEFFVNNQVPNNVTSYWASYSNSNEYVFNNIARLVNACITEKKKAQQEAGANWNEQQWIIDNKWDQVVLIPVRMDYTVDSSGSISAVDGVYHNLAPTYVKLKGGKGEENQLELEVVYTKFNQ